MIVVREVFVAKPGQASKLAKMMKEAFVNQKSRVMTDMAGDYNTVIVESEFETLADFDKMMQEYMSGKPDPAMESMKGYTEMYMTGRREIFRIW